MKSKHMVIMAFLSNIHINDLLPGLARFLDGLAIILAAYICYLLYFSSLTGLAHPDQTSYLAAVTVAIGIWTLSSAWFGVYEIAEVNNNILKVHSAFTGWLFTILVLVFFGFVFKVAHYYSRGWCFAWFGGTLVGFVLFRLGLWLVAKNLSKHGLMGIKVAICGEGKMAEDLLQDLELKKRAGNVQTIGFFSPDSLMHTENMNQPEGLQDLLRQCRRGQINTVIVAIPWTKARQIMHVLEELRKFPIDIRMMFDSDIFPAMGYTATTVAGIPMLNVEDRPQKNWEAFGKRALDIFVSLGILIALAIPMSIIAILVKLDSKGSVLFRQKRFGFNNKPIKVLKFRSMHQDLGDQTGAQRTVENDPRVTRIGKYLRRYSLDELPQFINVLMGNMSIVGPRAHAVKMRVGERYYHHVFSDYVSRHRVRPGITGWAQVNGLRGEVDTIEKAKQRLEFDLYYIKNWSVLFDIWIIIKTAYVVVFKKAF